MDFLLNEEQNQLRKSVREFAEQEIAPNVMKWDEASEFPLATVKELGKLGLMGIVFPAGIWWRGDGICGICGSGGRTVARGWIGGNYRGRAYFTLFQPYLSGRNEEQKKKYVSKLATGEYHRRMGVDRTVVRLGCG